MPLAVRLGKCESVLNGSTECDGIERIYRIVSNEIF